MKRDSIVKTLKNAFECKEPQIIKKALFPRNDEEWESLARWVRLECEKEDILTIDDIPLALGYPPSRFKRWHKNHAEFSEAYEYALYKIGRRRELLAHANKMDRSIVLKTMPLYNYEYRDLIMQKIDRSEEAKALAESKHVINVIMNKMPETDIVKPLSKPDKDVEKM